jgi:signal transduction histidine kinase
MGNAVRALWNEPRAPQPPARVWRDWVVVAALIGVAVLENALRQDIPWRPVGVLELVVLTCALMWRRTHPLAMVAVVLGVVIVVDTASTATHTGGQVSLYSMAFMLLLPYALLRWGSGREVVIGSAIGLFAYGAGIARDHTNVAEAGIGFVIMVFPAVLGASARFWATSRLRELDQVRLREREQLARELHDTVAHHVSAMVIRAQAGRVVAESRPAAAVDALKIIEAEGSRTLAEMRAMVGALRERDDADLAPQGGVADIERLARSLGDEPRVEVHMSGDLDDLSPSVAAATYRIAQESITNAMRHARHATRIDVVVAGADDVVRLTVRDDGDAVSAIRAWDGYGVVGMTERATLLGGTLEVGPGVDRGWVVDAVLPRVGPTR